MGVGTETFWEFLLQILKGVLMRILVWRKKLCAIKKKFLPSTDVAQLSSVLNLKDSSCGNYAMWEWFGNAEPEILRLVVNWTRMGNVFKPAYE